MRMFDFRHFAISLRRNLSENNITSISGGAFYDLAKLSTLYARLVYSLLLCATQLTLLEICTTIASHELIAEHSLV
jgi:hypothetical protein